MKHRMKLLAAAAIALWTGAACAQAPYPGKPTRFMVGFPPGGTNDIVARLLTPKLTEYLGQSVVVENRCGANASMLRNRRSRRTDGYTIMLVAPGHATNPWLLKLNFDSIKDFAFITQAAESQNLLVVHPSFPPKSVKELIAFSKKHPPGSINYGSSGTGTTVHLSAELFQFMTGVKWLHIPYKGGGPAVIDLLAGQHVIYFGNVPTVITHARAGKLRALAVTGPKRTPAAPEIPTVAESGVLGYSVTTAYGVAVPAKTPRPIIDRLHSELIRALNAPALPERLKRPGAHRCTTPDSTPRSAGRDVKWGRSQAAGIRAVTPPRPPPCQGGGRGRGRGMRRREGMRKPPVTDHGSLVTLLAEALSADSKRRCRAKLSREADRIIVPFPRRLAIFCARLGRKSARLGAGGHRRERRAPGANRREIARRALPRLHAGTGASAPTPSM